MVRSIQISRRRGGLVMRRSIWCAFLFLFLCFLTFFPLSPLSGLCWSLCSCSYQIRLWFVFKLISIFIFILSYLLSIPFILIILSTDLPTSSAALSLATLSLSMSVYATATCINTSRSHPFSELSRPCMRPHAVLVVFEYGECKISMVRGMALTLGPIAQYGVLQG